MKRFWLFLLAVALVSGICGCSSGGDDAVTTANVAGVYNFTKATGTRGGEAITILPPTISGTLTLDGSGGYSLDMIIDGERIAGPGTYTISGSAIVFDGEVEGTVSNGGRTILFSGSYEDIAITMEFTRS